MTKRIHATFTAEGKAKLAKDSFVSDFLTDKFLSESGIGHSEAGFF